MIIVSVFILVSSSAAFYNWSIRSRRRKQHHTWSSGITRGQGDCVSDVGRWNPSKNNGESLRAPDVVWNWSLRRPASSASDTTDGKRDKIAAGSTRWKATESDAAPRASIDRSNREKVNAITHMARLGPITRICRALDAPRFNNYSLIL